MITFGETIVHYGFVYYSYTEIVKMNHHLFSYHSLTSISIDEIKFIIRLKNVQYFHFAVIQKMCN